jgi:hypothetical protein
MAIHDDGGLLVADAIEARAEECKTFGRKVAHRRGEIHAALEPRLHDVPVGCRHLHEALGATFGDGERDHIARDRLLARRFGIALPGIAVAGWPVVRFVATSRRLGYNVTTSFAFALLIASIETE